MRCGRQGRLEEGRFAGGGIGVLCLDMLNLRCVLSRIPERNPVQPSLSKKELMGLLTWKAKGKSHRDVWI